jgi:N-acetylmuramoyl-L-alanine amidase
MSNPFDVVKPVCVLIVGHEKRAPGASFALGGSEYDYNKKVALLALDVAKRSPVIDLKVLYRDGIGITGVYKQAARLKPDACIELHFNAFNRQASGTETLCSAETQDKQLALAVHKMCCEVFERKDLSRGVKVLPRSARGGQNIYGLPGFANCLVEPFFGDNLSEARLAQGKLANYAVGLVSVLESWATQMFKA